MQTTFKAVLACTFSKSVLLCLLYKVLFCSRLESFANKEVCLKDMTSTEIEELRSAIEDHYYFELVLGMFNILQTVISVGS